MHSISVNLSEILLPFFSLGLNESKGNKFLSILKWLSGPDPGFSVGGGRGPILGGFWPPTWHFSVKMYVKMKELGPVGGGVCRHAPPRSAYGCYPWR